MEPRIQYAKTKDGVNIAFYTLGEGMPPLVLVQPSLQLQLEWQVAGFREWYERLADKRRVVRYDGRGRGLSDRDVTDFSLDAQVLDLETVVDRMGLERFALLGVFTSGPVAIAYAARHVNRISHLILWCSWARASDAYRTARAQALVALRSKDWETYTELLAQMQVGWSEGEAARSLAALIREGVTQETQQADMGAAMEFDVTAVLPQVKAPTLVLHFRQVLMPDMDVATRLASQIPDARLALLEGSSLLPLRNREAAASAIDDFLGEGEEAEPSTELPEGMAVLLFADIAESTALTEQLGDAAFRAKARELDTSLRSVIQESGGTPVEGKVLGDGVLAVFTSARQAIDCALRCEAAGEPLGLQLHLGIHAGDVIREGNNVYGGAVNIAARIAAASEPGEVLVSQTVRDLARTSAGVTFDDRGQRKLKGVEGRQRLFAVGGEAGG
jgi:class 3 adenylate cyclase